MNLRRNCWRNILRVWHDNNVCHGDTLGKGKIMPELNWNVNMGTDEIMEWIEKIDSYSVLCKIKKMYEDIYRDASCGEIYYTARKSAYATKFEITISDGRSIANMTIEGEYDVLPQEVYMRIIDEYKAQAEMILPFLDDRISLAEKAKKESDKKAVWFIITSAFLLYCFVLIVLGIRYALTV